MAATSSDEPVGQTRDHPTLLGIRTCRTAGRLRSPDHAACGTDTEFAKQRFEGRSLA